MITKSELIERLTILCVEVEYDNKKIEYTEQEVKDLLLEWKLLFI